MENILNINFNLPHGHTRTIMMFICMYQVREPYEGE